MDHTTISVEEQKAFNEWQKARAVEAQARVDSTAADARYNAAASALKAAEKKGGAEAIEKAKYAADQAQTAQAAARRGLKEARDANDEAQRTWSRNMAEHEPSVVGTYRRYIMQQPCIVQVIDPWYVTLNAKSPSSMKPNDQSDATMVQHNNHMHLTILDSELQP